MTELDPSRCLDQYALELVDPFPKGWEPFFLNANDASVEGVKVSEPREDFTASPPSRLLTSSANSAHRVLKLPVNVSGEFNSTPNLLVSSSVVYFPNPEDSEMYVSVAPQVDLSILFT